jgi:hypothetical protein
VRQRQTGQPRWSQASTSLKNPMNFSPW